MVPFPAHPPVSPCWRAVVMLASNDPSPDGVWAKYPVSSVLSPNTTN